MGQSAVTYDRQEYQGTAAATGGTFVAHYTTQLDKCHRLRATCIATLASAGHLTGSAVLVAEYAVENKNGTVAAMAAVTGSNNPSNAATTTFVASAAQASDFNAGGIFTLAWTITGSDATVTFTNVGNANIMNVTIVVDAVIVGST